MKFRLAVAHETIREQDIIAVDAEFRSLESDVLPEQIRVWAKVQRIERLNPLFPTEAGHELAATQTDPFDTLLLSQIRPKLYRSSENELENRPSRS